jgi:hypothetical protein
MADYNGRLIMTAIYATILTTNCAAGCGILHIGISAAAGSRSIYYTLVERKMEGKKILAKWPHFLNT